MKQLNARFILSNIVTALLLVVFMPYYREQVEASRERGTNVWYGYLLLAIVFLGMIAMIAKSYNLSASSKNKLHWHGRLFLILIYIGGFGSNVILIMAAEHHGNFFFERPFGMVSVVLVLIFGFIFLLLESHFLQERPVRKLPKKFDVPIDLVGSMYTSVGINLCWNHFVVGIHVDTNNLLVSIPTYLILMFFFVFSFERLFWYEIMSDSETKRDNLKTIVAILLVMAAGIVPMYVGSKW